MNKSLACRSRDDVGAGIRKVWKRILLEFDLQPVNSWVLLDLLNYEEIPKSFGWSCKLVFGSEYLYPAKLINLEV